MSTTLGASTLANPQTYEYSVEYRGASMRMADGTVAIDLVSSTAKRKFTLGWSYLTTAQKDTIVTAYAAIKNTSASFTGPDGQTATVTRDVSQDALTFSGVQHANGTRWSATLQLEEV